jgi:hypothetical protein
MASSSMATLACLVVLVAMIGSAYCGNIVLQVEKSCPNFALSVKGSNKEITQVDVREHGSDNLEPMTKSGESWTISKTLKGPLNIRLGREGEGVSKMMSSPRAGRKGPTTPQNYSSEHRSYIIDVAHRCIYHGMDECTCYMLYFC